MRHSMLVRKLIVDGLGAETSTCHLFDVLAAYFDYSPQTAARAPPCTLGVIVNLLLVHKGLRPCFCIQEANKTPDNAYVYDRALALAQRHFATVECHVGTLVCKPESRSGIEQTIRDGRESGKRDTAVGTCLGYVAPAELAQVHRQPERFSVSVTVEQSDEDEHFSGPSSLFAVVLTDHGKMVDVMAQAAGIRTFTADVERNLRIRLNVFMYNNTDNRPSDYTTNQSQ